MPDKKTEQPKKQDDKELEKALNDSFPASDPPDLTPKPANEPQPPRRTRP
ncbi:hypothetical protein FHS85_000576 [Rhodoligotrophos appendicifer]|nr:hypothetical protein [Rhodoligotrophos appendicifer]